jgi:hypothetical protein
MTVGHRQPRRLNLENRKRMARYGLEYLDHPVNQPTNIPILASRPPALS